MDSKEVFQKLIQAHDGDMALVYIYVAQSGDTDPVSCAKALFMTVSRVEEALEKLKVQGLVGTAETQKSSVNADTPVVALPADEPASYTAQEIEEAFSRSDYLALSQETRKVLGRELSKDDLEKLLDICRHLELPAETVFVLLHYCEKISSSKLRMSFIQRQAYIWKNRDIITVEQAEDFVEKDLELRSASGQIRQIVQIKDRNFTSKEQEYVSSWLSDGFTMDAIESAYEKTVNNTGKLSFPYMDKVLRNVSSDKSSAQKTAERKPKIITSVRKDSR